MNYKWWHRRWALVDIWTRHDGEKRPTVISKFWTKRGALFRHSWLSTFLRPRGGQAAIYLHDLKTDHVEKLSIQ